LLPGSRLVAARAAAGRPRGRCWGAGCCMWSAPRLVRSTGCDGAACRASCGVA